MVQQPSASVEEEVAAIVLAAGTSARMEGLDKIWVRLGEGALIEYAMRAMAATPGVTTVVAVAPKERHGALARMLEGANVEVRCVEGGRRRQDSVAAALAAAPEAAWYLVHDGARPFATPVLAARVLASAQAHGAAVPGVAVPDTLKRVDNDGRVLDTVDRASLRAIQTPQGFRGQLLRDAHARITDDVTDDASMVEALGASVFVVRGDEVNRKITTPADLEWARVMVAGLPASGRG